jgi:hypothetical protein
MPTGVFCLALQRDMVHPYTGQLIYLSHDLTTVHYVDALANKIERYL